MFDETGYFDDRDMLADFSHNKRSLTEIFFPKDRQALISYDSSLVDGFWKFLQKLQKIINLNSANAGCTNSLNEKKLRLNIRTTNYRLEDYIRHNEIKKSSHRPLTAANLKCLHLAFDMYLDFLQKQKFSRLVKLQRDKANLPIANYRGQILNTLETHQVIVVAGDTGCGKSTQVPQYLHSGQLDPNGQSCGNGFQHIVVTQPRRIACISLAARVSTEMLNERGTKVGYQVRFEKSRTKATRILFLTEGLLLRQMQMDPFLNNYDALILDEVHERHWQTDCLLGLVKCLIMARPELRVVLMSATINVNLFSMFFDNCPIIEVPGRLYPIELRYMPLTPTEIAGSSDRLDPSPYIRLLQRIDATYSSTERGDLLVFVPGMADIQAIMEPAKAYADQTKRWIILPLHSTLSASDQEKVFHVAPDGVRKCVLSTNIAETSLTIDGIRFVADSGKVKELSWDAQARMRCLKEFTISKASANQRKGRAGRTGPGVCFRFYTQEDYDAFEAYGSPEIQRVPLEELVLQMLVMGLPDVKQFPFIEPPEMKRVDEALELLKSHGAVMPHEDSSKNNKETLVVTPLGQLLADLPVEFCLGRMLITASLLRLVEQMLSLVAGMAVQSPLVPFTGFGGTQHTRRMEAMEDYESDHGDPFTIMNIFDEWIKLKSELVHSSDSKRTHSQDDDAKETVNVQKWCRRLGVQDQRLHEIVRLRSQFADFLKSAGLLIPKKPNSYSSSIQIQHLRNLNQARRVERVRTKRRKILTVQDFTNEGFLSDDDEDVGKSREHYASELRKWLNPSNSARARMAFDHDNPGVSVHDLELILCYDLSGLAESADKQNNLTQADLQLLKVVLAGGLYPQLAIGDSANAYRLANRGGTAGAGAELVFHTKTKGYVTLSPNDVFVRKPDALFPSRNSCCRTKFNKPTLECKRESSDNIDNGNQDVDRELPSGFAYDHQLLMYLNLMETTKPFLVNTIRVPALPTLLLYCREIDTNANAARIVFDSWLEVRFLDNESSQRALATTVWLRATMERLMKLELAECTRRRNHSLVEDSGNYELPTIDNRDSGYNKQLRKRCLKLQHLLAHSLTAFLACSPGGPYSLRRLLAADVKQLYRRSCTNTGKELGGPSRSDESQLPEPDPASNLRINPRKGGYLVTNYLTIDSLYPETLPTINKDMIDLIVSEDIAGASLDLAMRIRRQLDLAYREVQSEADPVSPVDRQNSSPTTNPVGEFVQGIVCDACGQTIPIQGQTQTALLRHRRHCHAKERSPPPTPQPDTSGQ